MWEKKKGGGLSCRCVALGSEGFLCFVNGPGGLQGPFWMKTGGGRRSSTPAYKISLGSLAPRMTV